MKKSPGTAPYSGFDYAISIQYCYSLASLFRSIAEMTLTFLLRQRRLSENNDTIARPRILLWHRWDGKHKARLGRIKQNV